jgi:peptidoglycan/LPS O-acetylase OafA/YrhL
MGAVPSRILTSRTLGERLDLKANGLNFLRLLLATGVIIGHAFPITGRPLPAGPFNQLLSDGFVDGFFAISGFLIVSSWVRRPSAGPFLAARVLRIFPAYWVCLILTAAVIAPLGVALSGNGFPAGFTGQAILYPLRHIALDPIGGGDIAGTPAGIPELVWNGSIWTLRWEFLCYLGVLALGLAGLFKRTWSVPTAFTLALLGYLSSAYGPIGNFYVTNVSRFGLMFLAGAMVYCFQDRIPTGAPLLVTAVGLVAVSAFLPDYRLLAALPLAYALITIGALIRTPRLRFRNDISYGVYVYAFPVSQVLACAGLWTRGPLLCIVLTTLLTYPLAAASWFVVEKPANGLKMRGRRPETVQEAVVAS